MNERIEQILKHPSTIPAVVGVVAFGVGTGVGYFLGRRTPKYDVYEVPTMDLDIASEREELPKTSSTIIDAEDYERARALVDKYGDKKPRVTPLEEIEIDTELPEGHVAKNVFEDQEEVDPGEEVKGFAQNDDDWDYHVEQESRHPSEPYILHQDEFYQNEMGFNQYSITYFEGDNIMADEEDVPIYNHENVTGPLRFGHGSTDPNRFYVRNHKNKAEYEITRNERKYSEEVAGLEIEHNDRQSGGRKGPLKFRPD